MKKAITIITAFILLLLAHDLRAQRSGADYFAGKWNVLLKGTPGGDARMFIVLEKKDTTMTGVVQDSTGKEMSKIDKVELTDTSATVYFNAQGYDVNMVMNKKDDDHITGSLLGMFDAEGERVKESKLVISFLPNIDSKMKKTI
jgi:hypothetical protein